MIAKTFEYAKKHSILCYFHWNFCCCCCFSLFHFFSLLIIFYAKSFLTLMKPQSVMFKSMQIKCCCCFFVCWYLSSNLLDCLHISNCLFVQSFSCSMCVFGFDFFFSFSLFLYLSLAEHNAFIYF